jgi:bifunctional DNase/RNase
MEKKYEVEVWGIAVDPINQSPIVVLRNKENPKEVIPIWIGHAEASGILMVLNNVELPRPMTYELMKNIIESLGGEVESIEVSDVREGTYYATIYIRTADGKFLEIDARPSDAINLALRFGVPIYVSEKVMKESKVNIEEVAPKEKETEEREEITESKVETKGEKTEKQEVFQEDFKQWLENIKPEDFLKFKKKQGEGN